MRPESPLAPAVAMERRPGRKPSAPGCSATLTLPRADAAALAHEVVPRSRGGRRGRRRGSGPPGRSSPPAVGPGPHRSPSPPQEPFVRTILRPGPGPAGGFRTGRRRGAPARRPAPARRLAHSRGGRCVDAGRGRVPGPTAVGPTARGSRPAARSRASGGNARVRAAGQAPRAVRARAWSRLGSEGPALPRPGALPGGMRPRGRRGGTPGPGEHRCAADLGRPGVQSPGASRLRMSCRRPSSKGCRVRARR